MISGKCGFYLFENYFANDLSFSTEYYLYIEYNISYYVSPAAKVQTGIQLLNQIQSITQQKKTKRVSSTRLENRSAGRYSRPLLI